MLTAAGQQDRTGTSCSSEAEEWMLHSSFLRMHFTWLMHSVGNEVRFLALPCCATLSWSWITVTVLSVLHQKTCLQCYSWEHQESVIRTRTAWNQCNCSSQICRRVQNASMHRLKIYGVSSLLPTLFPQVFFFAQLPVQCLWLCGLRGWIRKFWHGTRLSLETAKLPRKDVCT